MKKKLLSLDVHSIFLILILVFSTAYTIQAFSMPFGHFRSPEAGFVPRIVGIMAIAISVVLLLSAFRRGGTEESETLAYPFRFILFTVAFILFVASFRFLGYIISSVAFTVALCKIMGNKWWVSLLIGGISGVAFYLIFSFLSVPLPTGLLPF